VKVPAADALRTAQLLALKAMDKSKIDVARDAALHARIAELEKSATTK
jgi:hypothetical protein